jgi:hypothetical protein
VRIERVRPQLLRVSIHPLEMAALVTAARWLVAGQAAEPPPEAVQQLHGILASYDQQATLLGELGSAREERRHAG